MKLNLTTTMAVVFIGVLLGGMLLLQIDILNVQDSIKVKCLISCLDPKSMREQKNQEGGFEKYQTHWKDQWNKTSKGITPIDPSTRVSQNSRNTSQAQNKRRGIFYLKVNKAGSSTLQTMFNQYADKYDQIVGMPCSNTGVERHLVGWPEPFKPEHLIPLSKNFTYWEHLNSHLKYSHKIRLAMDPGSVFIASIREPFSHFYSYYNFYSMEETYRKVKDLNRINFTSFLDNVKTMPHLELQFHMPPSNPIAECFGLTRDSQYDKEVIKRKIDEIEKEFDLVIVVEYMDESLILLTECSDLTIDDVLVLENKNTAKRKQIKPNLTSDQYENLIQWNLADSMIYHHFNKTLWSKVEKYGRQNMEAKIKELNMVRDQKKRECSIIRTNKKSSNGNKTIIAGKSSEDMKRLELYCMMQATNHKTADNYFRKKMTERGVYDLEKANKTCKFPPGKDGE